jgi:hypothetical protein
MKTILSLINIVALVIVLSLVFTISLSIISFILGETIGLIIAACITVLILHKLK